MKAIFYHTLRGVRKGVTLNELNIVTKEVEFFLVESVDDIGDNHFIVYDPNHKKKHDWFYEYTGLEEYVCDGWRIEDLKRAIELGYVRIVNEVISL